MERLTLRQREILQFLAWHITERGYAPTNREVGTRFGLTSTKGIADHFDALRRKGMIQTDHNKSRGLRLTPKGWAEAGAPRLSSSRYIPQAAINQGAICQRCGATTFKLPCPMCADIERRAREREAWEELTSSCATGAAIDPGAGADETPSRNAASPSVDD